MFVEDVLRDSILNKITCPVQVGDIVILDLYLCRVVSVEGNFCTANVLGTKKKFKQPRELYLFAMDGKSFDKYIESNIPFFPRRLRVGDFVKDRKGTKHIIVKEYKEKKKMRFFPFFKKSVRSYKLYPLDKGIYYQSIYLRKDIKLIHRERYFDYVDLYKQIERFA